MHLIDREGASIIGNIRGRLSIKVCLLLLLINDRERVDQVDLVVVSTAEVQCLRLAGDSLRLVQEVDEAVNLVGALVEFDVLRDLREFFFLQQSGWLAQPLQRIQIVRGRLCPLSEVCECVAAFEIRTIRQKGHTAVLASALLAFSQLILLLVSHIRYARAWILLLRLLNLHLLLV